MKLTERNVVLYGACAVLAVLVCWGFALSGSPAKNRALMQDREVEQDVRCLACYAEDYYCKRGSLPKTGEEAEASALNGCYHNKLHCNWGQKIHFSGLQYRLDGEKTYTICARFQYGEAGQLLYQHEDDLPLEMRGYKDGPQCFTFTPRTCPPERNRAVQ